MLTCPNKTLALQGRKDSKFHTDRCHSEVIILVLCGPSDAHFPPNDCLLISKCPLYKK